MSSMEIYQENKSHLGISGKKRFNTESLWNLKRTKEKWWELTAWFQNTVMFRMKEVGDCQVMSLNLYKHTLLINSQLCTVLKIMSPLCCCCCRHLVYKGHKHKSWKKRKMENGSKISAAAGVENSGRQEYCEVSVGKMGHCYYFHHCGDLYSISILLGIMWREVCWDI